MLRPVVATAGRHDRGGLEIQHDAECWRLNPGASRCRVQLGNPPQRAQRARNGWRRSALRTFARGAQRASPNADASRAHQWVSR